MKEFNDHDLLDDKPVHFYCCWLFLTDIMMTGGIKVSCPKSVKYAACLLRRQKRKENTLCRGVIPLRPWHYNRLNFKAPSISGLGREKSQLYWLHVTVFKSNKMKENKSQFAKLLLLLIRLKNWGSPPFKTLVKKRLKMGFSLKVGAWGPSNRESCYDRRILPDKF